MPLTEYLLKLLQLGRMAITQEGTRVLDPPAYDALVDTAYRGRVENVL